MTGRPSRRGGRGLTRRHDGGGGGCVAGRQRPSRGQPLDAELAIGARMHGRLFGVTGSDAAGG